MKKQFVQLVAVAVAVLVVLFVVLWAFRSFTGNHLRNSKRHLQTIGEIHSVVGQVERRFPGTVNFEAVSSPLPLYNQDLVTTQKSSQATLILQEPEITLRLNENSRFIAELDATHPGALIGTLLSGTASVLSLPKKGKPDSFRLYKDGREILLNDLDKVAVPVLKIGATNPPRLTGSGALEPEKGLIITATKADDSASATPRPVDTSPTLGSVKGTQNEQGNDVLTNDDILRQLRNQSGFLQRCYLNYLHRNQSRQAATRQKTDASSDGIGNGGVVTVSFVVQSNGRVSEAKIVKSDFKDSTLHNCVTEVIERTAYRGFRGNPVPVLEFPITLQ